MNRILVFLLAFLTLTGCRTKAVSISKEKHTEKEITKSKKDSVFEVKTETKTSAFSFDQSQSIEMELITDKDSVGNSKEMHFSRYRDGPTETIIVRGGSVRLRTADNSVQSSSHLINNTDQKGIVRTENNSLKISERKDYNKKKSVETKLSFGLYFWLIIIGIIAFLIWRFKLFRGFSVIITKIKKYLNNI